MESFEIEQNLIVLKGLESNDPVSTYPFQDLLSPYTSELIVLWWAIWTGVLIFILLKFVVFPLIEKRSE